MNKTIGKRLLAALCVPAIILTLFVTGLFGATAADVDQLGGDIDNVPAVITEDGDLTYTLMMAAPAANGSVGTYTDNKEWLVQKAASDDHNLWWIQAFSGSQTALNPSSPTPDPIDFGGRVLAPQDFTDYDYFAFDIYVDDVDAVLTNTNAFEGNPAEAVINILIGSGWNDGADKDNGYIAQVRVDELADGWNRIKVPVGVSNPQVDWSSIKNIYFKLRPDMFATIVGTPPSYTGDGSGTHSAWRLGNTYLVRDDSEIADVPALISDGDHDGTTYKTFLQAPAIDGQLTNWNGNLIGSDLKVRDATRNHDLWWIQCFALEPENATTNFGSDFPLNAQDLTEWENFEFDLYIGNIAAVRANFDDPASATLGINFATGRVDAAADKESANTRVAYPLSSLENGWNKISIPVNVSGGGVDWANVRNVAFKFNDPKDSAISGGLGSTWRLGNMYLTKETPAPSYEELPYGSEILTPVAAAIRSELLNGSHALRFLFSMDKEAADLVNDGWTYESRGILTMFDSRAGLVSGATLGDKMLLENVVSGTLNNVIGTNTYLYYKPSAKEDYTLLITGIPATETALKTTINARGYVIFTKGSETRVLYTEVVQDSVFSVYERMTPTQRDALSQDVKDALDLLS